MQVSYAITWQEAEADPRSGRLELKPRGLAFEGSNGNGSAAEEVPYDDLSAVRIARASGDRLSGRPTLVLERRTGGRIRIASVAQPGIISELAEHLAALHLGEGGGLERARCRPAQDVYSWVRARPTEYMSSAPTPGPGDSEGGELYAP